MPKKPGIKAGSSLALVGAPEGFEQTLGELPDGVTVTDVPTGPLDRVILFVDSSTELEAGVERMAAALGEKGGLWMAWPMKASGVATDLSGDVVRAVGLAAGLVDYKIAAIDATWSGMCFARRKTP